MLAREFVAIEYIEFKHSLVFLTRRALNNTIDFFVLLFVD